MPPIKHAVCIGLGNLSGPGIYGGLDGREKALYQLGAFLSVTTVVEKLPPHIT